MKAHKLFLIAMLCFLFHTKSQAQDVIVTYGNLMFLKGQTDVNIEFDYDNLRVGEFTEDMYLKQKRKEFRKAPDADAWEAKWEADKAGKFDPKFTKQFNLGTLRIKLVATAGNNDAQYVMQVKTIRIEPGYYGTGMRRDTYVDVEITFVDTAHLDKPVCIIKAYRILGTTELTKDMSDQQIKIANAYGVIADKLSSMIVAECIKKIKQPKEVKEDKPTHPEKAKKEEKPEKEEKPKKEPKEKKGKKGDDGTEPEQE